MTFGQSNRATTVAVPHLIQFGGILNGPRPTVVGVTFALYRDQQGGAPRWAETQNVRPDSTGHYIVLLGETKSDGVPTDLFTSGEARWLGIQVEGQPEQSRVLLVAVPYA